MGGICRATLVEWPISSGGNGHFYEVVVVPEGIDWGSANSEAIAAGGYLATITSEAENDFIFDLVRVFEEFWSPRIWPEWLPLYLNGPWLGGFQPEGSPELAGNWQWVTGEPFVFSNWATGEPDNWDQDDRLQMYAGGTLNDNSKWNDHLGVWHTHGYVVEIPELGTLLLLGLVSLGLLRKRR